MTFIETKFAQPIHETYSSQYIITSAISENLSFGNIDGDKRKIGALSYPSVSHPSRSENVVIHPDIVDKCLRLDYVEEIEITDVKGQQIQIKYTDVCSSFEDNKIIWAGRKKQWNLPPGALIKVTAEPDGWVVRDEKGNIVNPD